MKKQPIPSFVAATLAIACLPLVGQDEQKPDPAPQPREMRQEAQPKERMRDNRRNAPENPPATPDQPLLRDARNQQGWRIGLLVEPVDPALRAHLSIPENSGVVVSQIVPGSPAAEAGFQKNDIITSANGTPVKELAQLRQQVEQSAGKQAPLRIAFIRKGKPQDITIKPPTAPRPVRPQAPNLPSNRAEFPAPDRIQNAIQPMIMRMNEQHKKLSEKIERQQIELEELRKEIKQLRKEVKEQNQKSN